MGNSIQKSYNKLSLKFKKSDSKIGTDTTCPICDALFKKTQTFYQRGQIPPYPQNQLKKQPSSELSAIESKWEWLKKQMDMKRINWVNGSDTIAILRSSVLQDSLKQIDLINIHKELKVTFIGEISSDAGGLIREWISILVLELMSPKVNIFSRCDTPEIYFKINPVIDKSQNYLFYFFGKIIGKAIFEKISIDLCFSPIIFKGILNEGFVLEDLKKFDVPIYNSLKSIKEEKIENLDLFFEDKESENYGMPLTELNKLIYIKDQINRLCLKEVYFHIYSLRDGILSVVSEITSFNSDELENIIKGKSEIDVKEWKKYTIYKDEYNEKHKCIIFFWGIMEIYNEEKRRKFLKFCTGTSRIPIGGFRKMESNRNTISLFCIEPIQFHKTAISLPIAHTCFNRLGLPKYPSKEKMLEAFDIIINNNITEFGIE